MRATTIIVLGVAVVTLAAGCGHDPRPAADRSASSPSVSARPTSAVTSAVVPPASPSATDPDAADPLIDHVHWGATDKGAQLQVFPTPIGRTDTFPSASARAWAEVLAAAPNADTPGMHDQFLCHWNFARVVEPDKPSWDLEPWRPAVGYAATVAAACNPGGPES